MTNEQITEFLRSIDFSQQEIDGGSYIDAYQTTTLFNIRNNRVNPKTPEYSKSCSACRLRVYKTVMLWYSNQEWKEFQPKIWCPEK